MRFSVLTIHPQMLAGFFEEGLLHKSQKKGSIEIQTVDIRKFADAPHFRVDDKPYGGGAGMVLQCEPIVRALRSVQKKTEKTRVVVLSAKGKPFTQKKATAFKKYDHLILICGRYEGIDERVADFYADEELRVGDYVLMGGELAAGIVIESVARLLPGVLGNPSSISDESFSEARRLEYDQYTRPPAFEGKAVPEVLLTGNHQKISAWRKAVETGRRKKKA